MAVKVLELLSEIAVRGAQYQKEVVIENLMTGEQFGVYEVKTDPQQPGRLIIGFLEYKNPQNHSNDYQGIRVNSY